MTKGTPARLGVTAVELYERDVTFRMPFRFGVVTLTAAPQAYARIQVRLADGRTGWGMAAELMAPKWFDKNPELSNQDNFEQLRRSLRTARALYLEAGDGHTPFGLSATCDAEQRRICAAEGLNGLIAQYGPALLDRAVLDAVCRLEDLSVYDAVRGGLAGIAPDAVAPDLDGFDADAFLAGLRARDRIAARHTVGLVDPLSRADQDPAARIGDGLPETLEEVVETYSHRWFKLKVAGDRAADLERLAGIAEVLDRCAGDYRASLDGNEQYKDVDGILGLWEAMSGDPRLQRLCRSIAFVEQPIARSVALEQDVGPLARQRPVILDESDDSPDAFPRGRTLGYTGISSKTCKGLYRSLINAMRCRAWSQETGTEFFMSGEDLTTQAGLAVQQDLALVALLGLGHVERNGHHYVRGMADLPASEQRAFRDAHADLYRDLEGVTVLRITEGELAIGSLACPGFAAAAEPDWADMRAL
jgi:hypothetical protein